MGYRHNCLSAVKEWVRDAKADAVFATLNPCRLEEMRSMVRIQIDSGATFLGWVRWPREESKYVFQMWKAHGDGKVVCCALLLRKNHPARCLHLRCESDYLLVYAHFLEA